MTGAGEHVEARVPGRQEAVEGGEESSAGVGLHNTRDCPRGGSCVVCGSAMDLVVETATTPVGVVCFERCEDCADDEKMPNLSLPGAVRRSGEHAAHLGIDVDQMAAAMEREETADGW